MTDSIHRSATGELSAYPDPSTWHDVVVPDARAWPRREDRHFTLVPTTCFNCEANCGLVAWIDKRTGEIAKLEGNPMHPASRGRNCAKGPATVNQIRDTERILHPLRRVGKRGEGRWERVSWDEALADIGARIGRAMREDRHDEVMYHVGRPGDDSYIERVLHAWGIDAHNSHTNICSSGARFGYAAWMGFDRPSADYANAKVIFLISSHLEAGHYFNPHAQRIMEGRERGAKIVCVDPRLSNTGSIADWWLPAWPGTEPVLLLAIARLLIEAGTWDRDFVRRWVNWDTYLRAVHPEVEPAFENLAPALLSEWSDHTPGRAAELCGIDEAAIREIAEVIGANLGGLASHTWRAAGAGNLGGWQTARCLWLLNVLTGSVGTEGGTSPNGWNKFIPVPPRHTEPHGRWNELSWAPEYPLAHHEMSMLLPHFLREGRGRVDTYFTRVYNPVWTNPDGFSWIEALTDEDKVGCHVALTPTWSETAWFADYVLPMGMGAERHDVASYETHSGRWIGFRQPVLRRYAELTGEPVASTRDANPGEVWEENEFWIALSWRIDPDGELGIRRHFESLAHPGEPMGVDEYYGHLFAHSIPGLPDAAAAEGVSPLEYMRRHGAFAVPGDQHRVHEQVLGDDELAGTVRGDDGVYRTPGTAGLHDALDEIEGHMPFIGDGSAGVDVEGTPRLGFPTPSRKLELYSETMAAWGWPEHATPGWIRSHVHWEDLDLAGAERILVPTFRIPTLVHTRSGNAKWLNEISHGHPLWLHPEDAERLGVDVGGLVRVTTRIGHFVIRTWRTEGIRPGVVACSHHMGRWRLDPGQGNERWSSGVVGLDHQGASWQLTPGEGVRPFAGDDPDSGRIWWTDAGVHQNLAFPVQPDPISGMHCWLQRVTVTPAEDGDRHGDVHVDTERSAAAYREWLALSRPGPGPGGLRRPLWFARPVKPRATAYAAGAAG